MATQAQITINAVAGSDTTLPLGVLVQLNNNGLGDETTYAWSIVSQPSGPADVLSNAAIQAPTFTPSKEGSYLIRLVVNLGQVDEKIDTVIAAVRELETGDRIPAAGETDEVSATVGWSQTAVDAILQRVTRFTDAGIAVGAAGAPGLVPGNVVWINSVTTLASGLPGQRDVPTFDLALATDPLAMGADLGIVIEGVDGSLAPALGDLIRVRQSGLFSSITNVGPAPTVGDAIYVDDLGALSLTPGTLSRQIGNVVAVGVGTYDGWFDPAAGALVGAAGGDLYGTYPNPFVVGLQGSPLPDPAVADGFLKRNAANTGWEETTTITPTSGAGGDLSGTYPNPDVVGLRGDPLPNPSIASGYLRRNAANTAWEEVLSAPPSGNAGGVLGYANSNYPNPAGLAPLAFPANTIPVKAASVGNPVIMAVDARTSNSQLGSGLTLRAGSGGPAAAGVAGGTGGSVSVEARTGTSGSTGASNAGLGGNVALTAGAGGSAASGTGVPGVGGSVTMQPGVGGTGNAIQAGGNAGDVKALVAAGGAGGGTTQGGKGSSFIVDGGDGGAPGGAAGDVTVTAGTGGAANANFPGNLGGTSSFKGGTGGAASAGQAAGDGGECEAVGGTGGAGSAAQAGAVGGSIRLEGGTGGASGGSTSGNGGAIYVAGGEPGGKGATSGQVRIRDRYLLVKPAAGVSGGGIALQTLEGGNADAAVPGGAGGGLAVTLGGGGDASSAQVAGAAGAATVTAGKGGKANNTGAKAATAGGAIAITGGEGGDGDGATAAANGGSITITGGKGGLPGTGNGGGGGLVGLVGGEGVATLPGGAAGIIGGEGGATGPGGAAGVIGGTGNGGANGGTTRIEGGRAVGGGTPGVVSIGTLTAPSAFTSAVEIGHTGIDVKTEGRDVGQAVTYVPVAGTTIPVTSPVILLQPAGAVAMTATPTLETVGITAGTKVMLIQNNANSTALSREGTLAGSGLRMSANTHTLGQYDTLTLVFDGTYWCEIAFANNA